LFIASNDKGKERIFGGVSDDNASYGGSALAECVAMRSARTAGYSHNVTLWTTVDAPTTPAVNPIEGECLQVLREFGADVAIFLVGTDKSVVQALSMSYCLTHLDRKVCRAKGETR
jgi:cytidine deaminase